MWDKDGNEPADEYTGFYGNGNASHIGIALFTHKVIISAIKMV
jgi:hypothetical protein